MTRHNALHVGFELCVRRHFAVDVNCITFPLVNSITHEDARCQEQIYFQTTRVFCGENLLLTRMTSTHVARENDVLLKGALYNEHQQKIFASRKAHL